MLAAAGQWGLVVSKDEKDEESGIIIDNVRAGSAAAAAGLKAGDRLLAIDGRWTENVFDCYRATAAAKPGSEVPVVVRRSGKEMGLTVRPRPGF